MYELVLHMRERLGDLVTNVVGYGHLGDGERYINIVFRKRRITKILGL